jgi:DAACS family dicarboxylate/amino acid:cation (Na+ or H+) symporter
MPKAPLAQHTKIFIGLTTGITLGLIANIFFSDYPELDWMLRNVISPLGQVFLRIIFMAVIPLIFSALALGVAELGDVRQLGRIGAKTLGFTILLTAVSVLIGMTLVNVVQPGVGLDETQRQSLLSTISTTSVKTTVANAASAKSIVQTLLDIIPKNPLADAVGAFDENYKGGGILALMFFSLFVGIALALARSERTEVFEKWLQGLYDVVMTIISIAMKLAPVGVAALVFTVTARLGMDVVELLGKYVLVVMAGLLLHMFVVYSAVLKYIVHVSPLKFFKRMEEVILTAFSTSSSNVTLPTAMRVTEEKLHVPSRISRFVLTLGSTANQNGTALYEGVTVLFLAQFFGVNLSITQQATVVLAAVLAGIGTAGVPGGSLPVIVLVLQSVGVPGEAIGVIFGVDRILDMSRTVLNVTGDVTAAMVIAKSEGNEIVLD